MNHDVRVKSELRTNYQMLNCTSCHAPLASTEGDHIFKSRTLAALPVVAGVGALIAAGSVADDLVGQVVLRVASVGGSADHGHPLGHHCDRPDQADRDHGSDTDRCAHLRFLWVALSLGETEVPHFWAPRCDVDHSSGLSRLEGRWRDWVR